PEFIVPDVLHVLTILPPHGSVVGSGVEPVVYFSHAVASAGDAASHISLGDLGAPPCSLAAIRTPVSVTVAFEAGQVAHLVTAAPLAVDTCFSIDVGSGILAEADDVSPHPVDVKSLFQTGP
ncbi:MAG: hypothetical protein HYZ27_12190, partial [Deltaproteobacteria bacterium]|nr:hypothetical protein [Deltaproteobacteria bacterium]